MTNDIFTWRSTANKWDTYKCDLEMELTHEQVLLLVDNLNRYYEDIGSDLRVRKCWKNIEACEVGEE